MGISANDIKNFYANLTQQREARRQAREKEESLLPPDLTGHIFNRCREEAAAVRAWLAKVEEECDRLEAAIADGEKEVRAACVHAMKPGRVEGDILAGFEVVPPEPHADRLQLSPEALAIRKRKVLPLRRRLHALEREAQRRQQEIGELRRIATRASQGEVALVHFLSDKWRARLELGPGTAGVPAKLSKYYQATVPVDVAGYPLPAEAIGEDGAPDMGPRGRARA